MNHPCVYPSHRKKMKKCRKLLKKEHNDAVDKSILLLQKMSALLRGEHSSC